MYECHITYDNVDEYRQECLEQYAFQNGWKTSWIEGDPLLGPGKRMFLTSHSKRLLQLHQKMSDALVSRDMPPAVRSKIEHIIHDSKVDLYL